MVVESFEVVVCGCRSFHVLCSHNYELFAVNDNSKTAKFCVQTMLEKLFSRS